MRTAFAAAVLAAVLISCGGGGGGGDSGGRSFWAINMENDSFYQTKADKLAEGNFCEVWVERGSGVSAAQAQEFAQEYDADIHNLVFDTFGAQNFIYQGSHYADIMELVDRLGDKNGKILILLLDIKDGFNGSGGYVAGYFYPGDFYASTPSNRSNEADMIYVDTYPSFNTSAMKANAKSTLAHELQHMVEYGVSLVKRNGVSLDTWINEGLSEQASFLYQKAKTGNGAQKGRIRTYNTSSTIPAGNNFFIWDRGYSNPNAVLDDYATAYLFFQWLYLQNNGDKQIFSDIAASIYADQRAVTSAAAGIGSITNGGDWETLLRTWMAANHIKSATGEFGYKNDPSLSGAWNSAASTGVTARSPSATDTTIRLFPGEGVYSKMSAALTQANSANIHYAALYKGANNINAVSPFSVSGDGVLLTYNISVSKTLALSDGYVTGVPLASYIPALSMAGEAADENYTIDANIFLRRLGRGDLEFNRGLELNFGAGDENLK